MNTKTKIFIVAVIAVFAGVYIGYWHKNPAPVRIENEVSAVPTQIPEGTSEGLTYQQVKLPAITLQEFTAPNFISARPAHKEVISLANLKEVRLKLSERIEAPSKILLFSAGKIIGQGNTTSPDAKELSIPVDIGPFSARSFPSGIYEVYYDACFVGDMCYKGQYAFYGVSADS